MCMYPLIYIYNILELVYMNICMYIYILYFMMYLCMYGGVVCMVKR